MNTSPVVPINDMPREYRSGLPKAHLALLEEAECEFDRNRTQFIREGQDVIDYARACDCSIEELRAAISRAR